MQSIEAGSTHTCAIRPSGTAICWGLDTAGTLGNGAAGSTPIQDHPLDGGSAYTKLAIANSPGSATCALDDGAIECWGSNAHGQLGVPTTSISEAQSPVFVVHRPLANITSPSEGEIIAGGTTTIEFTVSGTSDYTDGSNTATCERDGSRSRAAPRYR